MEKIRRSRSRCLATSPPPDGPAQRGRRPPRPLPHPRRGRPGHQRRVRASAPGSTSAMPANGSRRWPATATSPMTTGRSASPCRPSTPSSWPTPTARSTWAASRHGAAVLGEHRPAHRGVPARRRRAAGALTARSSGAASSASPAPASATTSCRTGSRPCPQVDAALRAGGSVADVGCGNGQALLFLAQGYPEATLVGYDNYAPAIAAANANARRPRASPTGCATRSAT